MLAFYCYVYENIKDLTLILTATNLFINISYLENTAVSIASVCSSRVCHQTANIANRDILHFQRDTTAKKYDFSKILLSKDIVRLLKIVWYSPAKC